MSVSEITQKVDKNFALFCENITLAGKQFPRPLVATNFNIGMDINKFYVEVRQPIAVSYISIYICLIDIRSKSKEQLDERRAGLSMNIIDYH